MTRPPRSTFFGVFLLAASIILLQIALTRVLAVMMWHHLTYVIISIALLGFGASGSILTARRARGRDVDPFDSIAKFAMLFGLSVLVEILLLGLVEVDSLQLWEDKSNLIGLFVMFLITATPFLLGGMALGLALTRFTEVVNRIYFVDLVGSGLGGAASVPLLMSMGASSTMAMAAALGLASALCFSQAAQRTTRAATRVLSVLGIVLCAMFSSVGPLHWEPPFAKGKLFSAFQDDPDVTRLYSATAQVEVGPDLAEAVAVIGGDIGTSAMELIRARNVGQDGDAPTMLIHDAGNLAKFGFLANSQTATGHVAFDARGGTDPKVLVIGVGGGIDVMISLIRGAASVTAVEINGAMIEMVTERFADYIGNLFTPGAHAHSDRIKLVHGEGRSYVSSTDETFDLIQMSGVDSLAALSTGAYTLSESYLYTVEAVRTFYGRLNADGYINYSRRLQEQPNLPRETLRLVNIAHQALEELGIDDPASQIAVFCGRAWASTIIKRGVFTKAEIDAFREFADREGFVGLVFDPLAGDPDTETSAAAAAGGTGLPDSIMDRLIASKIPGLEPPQVVQLRNGVRDLYRTIVAADRAGFENAVAALATPFPPDRQKDIERGIGEIVHTMFSVQTALRNDADVTRQIFYRSLRGTPDERREFIENYENDITPSTDDAPFFFNYYRYSALFEQLLGTAAPRADGVTGGFPAGHMVLMASLAQIVVLAVILIFWPLRRLAKAGQRVPGTWRYFAYFAALGAGFMFVEIVLMQKLVIFLGHPVLSISVVLSSLLVAAGLGSLFAGRIEALSRATLLALGFAITLVLLGLVWFLNHGAPAMLGLPLALRVLITVLVVAPVGLVLGMPFPTGMRIVAQNCPQLLPWCWAVNGFLSVFAAMFCIVLAMQIGFTASLVVGIGVYLCGMLAMPAAAPRAS